MYRLPPDQWKEIQAGRRMVAELSRLIPSRRRLPMCGLPAEVITTAEAGGAVEPLRTGGPEGLYRIPHGWAWPRGAHFDAGGRLLDDLSPGITRPAAWWLVRRFRLLPPVVRCPGTLFSLAGDGAENLYHWTLEILPRLRWLDPARRGQVRVLARQTHPFHRASLEAAGFPASAIIPADSGTLYQADELLVAKVERGITPENLALARELYLKAAEAVPRSPAPLRLYISRNRATSRRIVNEDELLRVLEPRGFRTVYMETLPLPEQLALVRDAEAILAPTGAGLSHIHLCPPRARLLVIMPERCEDFAYRDMAKMLGLDAQLVIAPLAPGTSSDPVKADLRLDRANLDAIAAFAAAL